MLLMRETVGPDMGIKAAGGIRSAEDDERDDRRRSHPNRGFGGCRHRDRREESSEQY